MRRIPLRLLNEPVHFGVSAGGLRKGFCCAEESSGFPTSAAECRKAADEHRAPDGHDDDFLTKHVFLPGNVELRISQENPDLPWQDRRKKRTHARKTSEKKQNE